MGRKRKSVILWLVVSSALLFGAAGCTEEQLSKIDRAVADANVAAGVGQAIAESPAAVLIPPKILAILELLGFAGAVAVAVWQKIRASKLLQKLDLTEVTTGVIIRAIEGLPDKPQADAKVAIGKRMQAQASASQRVTYASMNAVVDGLKPRPTA